MSAVGALLVHGRTHAVSCVPGKRVVRAERRRVLGLAGDEVLRVQRGRGAGRRERGGRRAWLLGMAALAGTLVGSPEARLSPFADTTAIATAVPIATVATAPPPMNSSRRRLLRVSDASASAAQSGVGPSLPLVPRLLGVRFPGIPLRRGSPLLPIAHGAHLRRGPEGADVAPARPTGDLSGRVHISVSVVRGDLVLTRPGLRRYSASSLCVLACSFSREGPLHRSTGPMTSDPSTRYASPQCAQGCRDRLR